MLKTAKKKRKNYYKDWSFSFFSLTTFRLFSPLSLLSVPVSLHQSTSVHTNLRPSNPVCVSCAYMFGSLHVTFVCFCPHLGLHLLFSCLIASFLVNLCYRSTSELFLFVYSCLPASFLVYQHFFLLPTLSLSVHIHLSVRVPACLDCLDPDRVKSVRICPSLFTSICVAPPLL